MFVWVWYEDVSVGVGVPQERESEELVRSCKEGQRRGGNVRDLATPTLTWYLLYQTDPYDVVFPTVSLQAAFLLFLSESTYALHM